MANGLHDGQPRDTQRSRLYKADDVLDGLRVSTAAKRHLTDSVRHAYLKRWAIPETGEGTVLVPVYYPSVESVQDYVDAVLASAWFRRRWGFRRITVAAASSATSTGGWGDVNMSAEHRRSEAVILHEIAHNLCDFYKHAYHGPEFAAILLTLVKHQMGRESYNALRAAFATHRVKYRAGMKAVPKPDEARRRDADRRAHIRGDKVRTTTRVKAAKAVVRAQKPLTYEQCYAYGERSSTGDPSIELQSKPGFDHHAYDDGYLDSAAGRERYHLRDCQAHHNGPGGCGSA